MLALQTILHPTDFSEHSNNAFHLACALARDYNARLVVLLGRGVASAAGRQRVRHRPIQPGPDVDRQPIRFGLDDEVGERVLDEVNGRLTVATRTNGEREQFALMAIVGRGDEGRRT